MVAPVERLVLNIEPHQSGSGDPSPSNIRPISGYDAVNVVRAGKNLIDLDAFTAGGISNAGLPDSTSGRIVDTEPIIIDDSLSYTISAQYAESAYDLRIIYSVFNDSTLVRRIANVSIKNTSATLNVSGGNKLYICLFCDQLHPIVKSSVSELQLEIGTTKTAYTPFVDRTTYPISLSSAGTVYGGTLDVTSGVLTVTDGYIAEYAGETLPSTWMSDRDVYASGTTPTTGAQVVYELATPLTYHLTPTEVTTLLGENTIWMDAEGELEMTYTGYIN